MLTKLLLSIFALASSTTGLLFATQSIATRPSTLLLIAYPYLVPAFPLSAIDTTIASNGAPEQAAACEEHHHRQNHTSAAPLTNAIGDSPDADGHNHTTKGTKGAANETAIAHHKHRHNCTATADGKKPSPTNAVLTTANAGADAANVTTTGSHHHHHNCSETANQAQPSAKNAVLASSDEGGETGNSSSHGHHHRHNCIAADAAAVTATVLPPPPTSATV
jgi:hypothetical protein